MLLTSQRPVVDPDETPPNPAGPDRATEAAAPPARGGEEEHTSSWKRMVAEMAHCAAVCLLADGDRDVDTPDSKENSVNTFVADSSEEDEEDQGDGESSSERDEVDEDGEAGEDPSQDGEAGEDPSQDGEAGEDPSQEEIHIKSQCEKCKAALQRSDYEKVTPRNISKGQYQVQLAGEGTYECSVTSLVFEVSEQALVRYSVLSWSKYAAFLQDSWKFAGPIFNVHVVNKEASVLKSILFPHSLCLADPEYELRFSVLHIKDSHPLIEPSVDHSGSHVRWHVSSLSPVGPIMQSSQPTEHHGAVLVYKELGHNNTFSFRVYLASNNSSDIKDIGMQVRSAPKRYRKIDKPPICNLAVGKYHLVSQPEGEISPKELKFTFEIIKLKGYFEAFFEQPPPFTLSLKEMNTDETVWSATIREGDCEDNTVVKPRKPTGGTRGRKRSSSASEEEVANKKFCCMDQSDGHNKNPSRGQDLSDRQLLYVAETLGQEWEQAAIYLDLSITDLDDIKAEEKSVPMQKLKMLVLWKRRRSLGEATAQHLLSSLKDLKDLPCEAHQLLKDEVKRS